MSEGHTMPLTEFLCTAAETLLRLNAESAPVLLTKRGRSVAVLVDVETYGELERLRRLGPEAEGE